MAKLRFDVTAKWQDVEKLRQEVEALKSALKDFNVSGDMKGFDEMNKKYAEATGKLKEYEQQMQKSQQVIEQMNLSTGIVDDSKRITAELNNATDVFVEQQLRVKELDTKVKNLTKSYMALTSEQKKGSEGSKIMTELSGATADFNRQNEVLKQLRKSYTDNIKVESAAADSLVALRLQLRQLTAEYDRLSQADREADLGNNLVKQIQELNTQISAAEQATGRFQRNVGNYASAWNGLGISVQQVARELPSMAMGFNTFFLAISNNLPMLVDEFKRAAEEYKNFKKEMAAGNTNVQRVVSPWKQLLSSILSWQTALVVGITVLSMYGDEIIDFAKRLFSAGNAAKDLSEIQDDVNKKYAESTKSIGKQITNLKQLQEEWNKLNGNISGQTRFIQENKTAFEEMGVSIKSAADAENLLVNNTDTFIEALKLRAQATAAQELASEQYAKQIKLEQEAREEAERAEKQRESKNVPWWYIQDTRNQYNIKGVKEINEELAKGIEYNVKKLEEEANAAKEAGDAYFDLGTERENAASKLLENSGIEQYNKYDEEQAENAKKSAEKQAEKQKKIQAKVNNELLELQRRNQQAQIDLMEEGAEKKLAQINLDYDNAIAEIRKREQEWKEAQGGQLTEEQTKEIRTAYVNEYVKKMRSEQQVETDEFEAERKAMNKYLEEYGTFQQKKFALNEKYTQLIAKATTEGEKLSLGKEWDKELTDLEIKAGDTTNAIIALFGDMSGKSLKELEGLAAKGQEALEFIKNGQWDATTGARLGITDDEFRRWQESPEIIKQAGDALKEIKGEADALQPSFIKVRQGLNQFFNSGNDAKKLQEALSDINDGVNEIMSSVGFLSDTFSKLGDSFGGAFSGIADGLNVAMDAVNSAMQGAQAGAMFGPIGAAAGAAIGVVTSLASSIAKIHDKKNEQRIQRLQDQIDVLDASYNNLGRSIEKAYSTDASKLIDQQNELLEQQKLLIQQQILEEQDKKKTDDDRIKQWQQQIEDINNQIKDNAEQAQEAIAGISFDTFRNNFLDTLMDMDSSAEDFANDFESYLQRSILDSLMASKYDEKIKQLYNQWTQLGDNGLTESEVEKLRKEQQAIVEQMIQDRDQLAEIFGWKNELEESAASSQQASAGVFETMSQDSAYELNGRFTALQMIGEEMLLFLQSSEQLMSLLSIKASMDTITIQISAIYDVANETRAMMANIYIEIQQINENTTNTVTQLKKAVEKLTSIETNTNRI